MGAHTTRNLGPGRLCSAILGSLGATATLLCGGPAHAQKWEPVVQSAPLAAASPSLPAAALTSSPGAVAASGRVVLLASTDGTLQRSTDGGRSFRPAGEALPRSAILAVALEADLAFVATGAGLYRSTDGGRTFGPVILPPLSAAVRALTFASAGPGMHLVLAAAGAQLLRSTDDGKHFVAAAPPIADRTILSLFMIEDHLYAAAAGLPDAPPSAHRIYRLTDDGKGFVDLHQGSSVVQHGKSISVLVSTLGVLRQYLSSDGGQSWQDRSFSPASMNAVAAYGELVFAATGSGVLCSSDGGRSFGSYNEGLGEIDVRLLALVDHGDSVPGKTLLAFSSPPVAGKATPRLFALDLDQAKTCGLSPQLLDATSRRDAAAVAALVAKGADPRARVAAGTALHVAARLGDATVARALLDAGADANAVDGEGLTALLGAITAGSVETASVLLEHGADARTDTAGGVSALELASGLGHAFIVEALLAHGADPEALDREGMTPLIVAAETGSTAVVQALCRRGAKVGHKSEGGHSAIGFALSAGHGAVAKALLDAGADANEMDTGVSLLVLAVASGDASAVEALLTHGADPNVHTARGETALGIATSRGDEAVARILREHGAVSAR